MSQQIIKDHNIEALKVAASWPGAGRAMLVTLATVLAATGADHDGLSYFEALAASQPDQVLPLALAGYFQVRAGEDIPAGLAKLDDAAGRDLGPAQYYRGLALAALPAEAGRAKQAVTDLEFVLAVRDQFPSTMIRAVYHGLAAAYAARGQDDLAAKAAGDSGLSSAPAEARLQFSGGWEEVTPGQCSRPVPAPSAALRPVGRLPRPARRPGNGPPGPATAVQTSWSSAANDTVTASSSVFRPVSMSWISRQSGGTTVARVSPADS